MATDSLHVRDDASDGSCVCGALWVPSGRNHPRSPVAGPGVCWNEGTMQGDVWELKQMVAELTRRIIAIGMVVKRGGSS